MTNGSSDTLPLDEIIPALPPKVVEAVVVIVQLFYSSPYLCS